jgi:diketogulonate reductase-like aldo/keto reductase
MVGRVLKDPTVLVLAQKYKRTPAQIVLRWELQKDIVTIPKSTHKERIVENAGLYDFELSDDDVKAMEKLDRGERSGSDPMKFSF